MVECVDFTQRDHFGNFESNISFLNETGVIKGCSKILEIGCGKGHLLNYFYKKDLDITATEINASFLEESKKFYGKLPTVLVQSELLPFSNHSFDVVLSFDVFEHIPNSDIHLQEVYRVLRNGGFYLLQTPNKATNFIFETIRWKSFTKWGDDHCSLHNYWGMKRRLEKNGFEVVFYDMPVVNEFFKLKIKTYLGKFGIFLLGIINLDKLPRPFRTNFYIKARKKD